MLSGKVYEYLLPKLGHDAAKLGQLNRYASIAMVIVGFASVVFIYTTATLTVYVIATGVVLVLLPAAAVIYTQIRFARAVSEHFNAKVPWYSVPVIYPTVQFDSWIRGLKDKNRQFADRLASTTDPQIGTPTYENTGDAWCANDHYGCWNPSNRR